MERNRKGIAASLKLTSATLLLYACRVDFSKSRAGEASKSSELDMSSEAIASCNLQKSIINDLTVEDMAIGLHHVKLSLVVYRLVLFRALLTATEEDSRSRYEPHFKQYPGFISDKRLLSKSAFSATSFTSSLLKFSICEKEKEESETQILWMSRDLTFKLHSMKLIRCGNSIVHEVHRVRTLDTTAQKRLQFAYIVKTQNLEMGLQAAFTGTGGKVLNFVLFTVEGTAA